MQRLKKNAALQTADHEDERAATMPATISKLISAGTPVALFLDIDGTLLDVALTPSTVRVPPDLSEVLGRIRTGLSGAVAIVTGRPIAEADHLLQPLKLIAAGVHGAEMRLDASEGIKSLTPSFDPALRADIKTAAESMPGIVMEDKGTGVALHYRLAPELHRSLLLTLETLIPKYPGQFTLCEGRKVVEVLPVGFSKGRALQILAALPQFTKRVPIMIGDDIADIDAFRVAEALGGYGLKVAGENFSMVEASFSGPSDVLAWLRELGDRLASPMGVPEARR